jgi:uncharacterized protein (DUF4415 family)
MQTKKRRCFRGLQRAGLLTPYVSHLLQSLPRRSEWVFSSLSTSHHITPPHKALAQAVAVAGIDGLTLHGLRRSFGSLAERLEIPAGVVAQVQGHKPSATAEKHYRVRPLGLLRGHHERIEAWVLEQAGVTFARGETLCRNLKPEPSCPPPADDAAIAAAALADPEAVPFTDAEWAKVKPLVRRDRPLGSGTETQVALRLDVEVLQRFKASGDGWQTRINEALKSWVQTHA